MTVIDLFAGCGGWDVGARDLGIDPIGIEMDADACATRALHGMPTIRADLTTLDPLRFAGIDGLIASPTMEHQRGAGMAERHGDRDPRPIHAPAPTMTAGAGRRIKVDRWIDTRRDQRPDGNAIRLNIAEGLVLQSFPHDFALAGNKTSQWRQVGNAVPPLLSKVTLAALLRLESEAVAA